MNETVTKRRRRLWLNQNLHFSLFGLLAVVIMGCVATRPGQIQALVEIQINNSVATIDDYVTWAPTRSRIRLVNSNLFSNPIEVSLRNMDPSQGGQLLFDTAAGQSPPMTTATQPTLDVTLPANGDWVNFAIAGQFGSPSVRDKDAVIEVIENRPTDDDIILGRKALMVRVRKNANSLAAEERDRFLDALAILNMTFGNYDVFQEIHAIASSQAHGGPAFLPWHRVYTLRIERELQAIDPSVTLPYWKFDQPAPAIFNGDFMGGPPQAGQATFSLTNPIRTWTIQGLAGISRSPSFGPAGTPAGILSEAATLNLGGAGNLFDNFRSMEGNPHGTAHVRAGPGGTGSWIGSIPTAVRDPLFFMLHCNIDRLWAKWQWAYNRYDSTQTSSYDPLGSYTPGMFIRDGHFLEDTMWPWNGVTGLGDPADIFDDRPSTAPGGAFPQTVGRLGMPPSNPRPLDTIDYESNSNNWSALGFAYDDVPFKN